MSLCFKLYLNFKSYLFIRSLLDVVTQLHSLKQSILMINLERGGDLIKSKGEKFGKWQIRGHMNLHIKKAMF